MAWYTKHSIHSTRCKRYQSWIVFYIAFVLQYILQFCLIFIIAFNRLLPCSIYVITTAIFIMLTLYLDVWLLARRETPHTSEFNSNEYQREIYASTAKSKNTHTQKSHADELFIFNIPIKSRVFDLAKKKKNLVDIFLLVHSVSYESITFYVNPLDRSITVWQNTILSWIIDVHPSID